jgi:hypothetical protein
MASLDFAPPVEPARPGENRDPAIQPREGEYILPLD